MRLKTFVDVIANCETRKPLLEDYDNDDNDDDDDDNNEEKEEENEEEEVEERGGRSTEVDANRYIDTGHFFSSSINSLTADTRFLDYVDVYKYV
ncbi:hypothetical protein M0802_006476 [Mischocyttarus mexicanus]|nr:hypothetical protein M0802_006476 [Mischocyttarus mexicanus]